MIDINTALGMVERPLQVGDWVALIDPQPEGLSQLTTDLLCKLEWPRRVTSIANPNAAFVDGFSYCCDRSRFRRVDPPRDEVAELREQVRILNEICDDIRGTFWYSRDGIVDLATYVAQDYAELRCQLATARAESAAMREAFSKRVSFGCHFWKGVNDTYIRFNDREKSLAAEHAIGSFLQGTAGRELLDELQRKDERIADLERQLAEHSRDAELCRELRALLSGVDPLQAECDVRVVVKTEDDSGRFLDVMKAIRDGGAK